MAQSESAWGSRERLQPPALGSCTSTPVWRTEGPQRPPTNTASPSTFPQRTCPGIRPSSVPTLATVCSLDQPEPLVPIHSPVPPRGEVTAQRSAPGLPGPVPGLPGLAVEAGPGPCRDGAGWPRSATELLASGPGMTTRTVRLSPSAAPRPSPAPDTCRSSSRRQQREPKRAGRQPLLQARLGPATSPPPSGLRVPSPPPWSGPGHMAILVARDGTLTGHLTQIT